MNAAVREALARESLRLRDAGIESARLDARVLLAKVLGVEASALLAWGEMNSEQLEAFDLLISRRARREPLAYITGTKEFWSLSFEIGPGVLIPRPETETLLEEALRFFPDDSAPLRVLDVGTGSGCLLIGFLAHHRGAEGVGIDISKTALDYARRNATWHGLSAHCRFFEAEWEPPGDQSFDAILVNPPYLTDWEFECSQPEIGKYEPRSALAAGPDGLEAMRALGPMLARRLSPKGRGFLEVGAGQSAAVARILQTSGLEVAKVAPDLSGVARCLVVGRPEQVGRLAIKNSVGKGSVTR